jgi:hypothetical protein
MLNIIAARQVRIHAMKNLLFAIALLATAIFPGSSARASATGCTNNGHFTTCPSRNPVLGPAAISSRAAISIAGAQADQPLNRTAESVAGSPTGGASIAGASAATSVSGANNGQSVTGNSLSHTQGVTATQGGRSITGATGNASVTGRMLSTPSARGSGGASIAGSFSGGGSVAGASSGGSVASTAGISR